MKKEERRNLSCIFERSMCIVQRAMNTNTHPNEPLHYFTVDCAFHNIDDKPFKREHDNPLEMSRYREKILFRRKPTMEMTKFDRNSK